MAKKRQISITKEFEKALEHKSAEDACFVLRLYVAGLTARSKTAISNAKALCQEHLDGRYQLEVIDIYQQLKQATGEQIVAAPTLVKKLPLPVRKLIGDLSDTERILVALGIKQSK